VCGAKPKRDRGVWGVLLLENNEKEDIIEQF
jgi:hypothetical protein